MLQRSGQRAEQHLELPQLSKGLHQPRRHACRHRCAIDGTAVARSAKWRRAIAGKPQQEGPQGRQLVLNHSVLHC
jgi:hypothetical protein